MVTSYGSGLLGLGAARSMTKPSSQVPRGIRWDRTLLQEALCKRSSTATPFREQLAQHLAESPCSSLSKLNDSVRAVGIKFFTRNPMQKAVVSAWYTCSLRDLCHKKWESWRLLKGHYGTGLQSLFVGWRLAARVSIV